MLKTTPQPISGNTDIMQVLLSYLPRKQKVILQQVCKSFGAQISFKSLVSIRLLGTNVVIESNLLEHCVESSRKIEKLQIEEAIVDIDYVNAFERQLKSKRSILGKEAGIYFKSRVKEVCLTNMQFCGETDIKRNFAVVKFISTIGSFQNLQKLELKSLGNAPLVFQGFARMHDLSFAKNLKTLIINACILKEMNASNWGLVQPANDKIFADLNSFIVRLENLERLELIGMSIVDHLQDLCLALKRPKLKALVLPFNGIEYEYCIYFQHILNYETLQELDLSSNWFGVLGLQKFSSSFAKFVNLKKLNLNNNKLCTHQDHDPRPFRDVLLAVAGNLTDLQICENSIYDSDMVDFLIPAIKEMRNLKSINLYKNRLSKVGLVGLYNALIMNDIHLQKYLIACNQLLDDGIAELLPLVLQSSQLQLLGLTSTRITVKSAKSFVQFFEEYGVGGLTLELKLIDGKRDKTFTEWKKTLSSANRNCVIKF